MKDKNYSFLFIEGPLPESERFRKSKAFSVAGNNAVKGIVLSLRDNGLEPDIILAHFMEESFPKNKKIFFGKENVETEEGLKVKLLPFINITPIKQTIIGIEVFFEIIFWGFKNIKKRKIICSYNLSVPPLIFVLRASQIIKAKKIAVAYDVHIPGETVANGLKNWIEYNSYRRHLKDFDGLINIRQEITDELAPNVKSIVIEPGISKKAIEILKETKVNKKEHEHFNIIFAGPLEERNGIEEAIDSMKYISDPDVRLNIVGDGEERDYVLKNSASDPRIIFWGWIPYENVLKMYGTADVILNLFMYKKIDSHFVYPSKLIECLMSGIPTITTNFCEKIDTNLKDKAFLLKGESAEEIAKTIIDIKNMDKQKLEEITARAQNYIENEYSWEVLGKKISDFITEFIPEGK